ncbi:MAG TPA: heavy metal-binding domain-containing protein [Bacteroidia bacterium]|nr:heavy metal-binding domain-containing protein [Bacteroidia bacterium]
MKQDPLMFYLMNKKGKPVIDTTITATAEFTFQDSSIATVQSEPKPEGSYAVQLQDKTKPFICLVNFQIKGENVMARFDGGVPKSNILTTSAIYTCPMHLEVQSDKQGSCPKCAMALVKK